MKEKIKHFYDKIRNFFGELSHIVHTFGSTEKAIFYSLCIICIASLLAMIGDINEHYTVNVPAQGGSLSEGIIGFPRFINPVLAVSDVDHDLTALVYSGLLKTSSDGSLTPDLAQSYTVSSDGLTYDFILRPNATFQDGQPVTADDVIFTIDEIQDSSIKSPLRPEFYDVQVQKVSDTEVQFILKKPYSPFLQNLTVGILPKHLWDNLSPDEFSLSQYNVEPIGSGPYKISSMQTLQKNMLLIPTYYDLTPFNNYALGEPYIADLIINFYRDESSLISAYNGGAIEAMSSISPDNIPTIKKQPGAQIQTSPLSRVYAVFFNQNQSAVLGYPEVRQALNLATNRTEIVNKVLDGYGEPIVGPIPAGMIGGSTSTDIYNLEQAEAILTKAGWVKSTTTGYLTKDLGKKQTVELDVTISTLNSPDLVQAAQLIQADWQALGAKVDIEQFDFGDLQQNIIRPRKFDALLYGTVIGRDMDFFSFWDSSQRNDPGLNISMYANSKADTLLETARTTSDPSTRMQDYLAFQNIVEQDVPAVFLYSPDFIYVTTQDVQELHIGTITMPYERFLDINSWYIETNNLWKMFLPKSQQ